MIHFVSLVFVNVGSKRYTKAYVSKTASIYGNHSFKYLKIDKTNK